MNKSAFAVLASFFVLASAPAFAQSTSVASPAGLRESARLYDTAGNLVGKIYRVTREGNAEVILKQRIITIPASTLTDVNGRVTTSLSKADLLRTR